MEKFYYANQQAGMSPEETKAALLASLEGRTLNKALIIPPDFTRFHSNAGLITSTLSAEELEAENAVKYVINDGTVVRVTYEDGTVFILNYNRFAVSVDGQVIDAVSFIKM